MASLSQASQGPGHDCSTPARDRAGWARALRLAQPKSKSLLGSTWDQELAQALDGDLNGQSADAFLENLAAIVGRAGELDNVPDWHDAILALRATCVPSLREKPDEWFQAESLFERAHLLIAAVAERIQGQRRVDRETMLLLRNQMSEEVKSLHEDQAVMQLLSTHLPRMQIPSFYVARVSKGRGPGGESRLVQAYDSQRGSAQLASATFSTGQVVPVEVRPQARHTMVVQGVTFSDQSLGFCAAEMGPENSLVYQCVREMLSSGLQNASLLRKVVSEVSMREQAERARLEGEMNLAQRIQSEILPKERAVSRLEIATALVPASEVGGDYFDILPVAGGCWLGIGDVAGHGLDAGLIMLMIQSIVAATTRSLPHGSPQEVWNVVNAILFENIRERLGRDEHATLSLLRYEESGDIAFAGAHEDFIVLRAADGRCEMIPTLGVWAGIFREFDEEELAVGHFRLTTGDVLILYTDGITEAMNEQREPFGLARLRDTLTQVSGSSPEAIKDHIMARVFAWSNVISDDRTLVVARYTLPLPMG